MRDTNKHAMNVSMLKEPSVRFKRVLPDRHVVSIPFMLTEEANEGHCERKYKGGGGGGGGGGVGLPSWRHAAPPPAPPPAP
eukprot:COSAG06_NODE_917_length_11555_cov_62.488041_1_plen_80_part_10